MPRDSENPCLLVAAGGTGGHIYPGLAVAKEFAARHPGARLAFVGTERGMEEKIIGAAGFEVLMVRAQPLRGGSLGRRLKGLLALVPSLADADATVRKVRPDAVLGVGGYISGPLVLAAALRRVPTLILEPNVEPGLANRWLGRFVDAAAVAWDDTVPHFGAKSFVSGNPVRAEIAAVPDVVAAGELRVLLFGGSQGSRILNDTMNAALPSLPPGVDLTHQTGPTDLERVRTAYARAGRKARVEPYLPDMDREYARCHLVVARAGATTCAELAAAGRGAVLVPLEIAGAHQGRNAEAMERLGAAEIIREADLTGPRLAAVLSELAHDPERTVDMGRRARRLARPDAARKIVDKLDELIERRQAVP